jgi:ABC-type polysaccharide/polyol phosphate export permease
LARSRITADYRRSSLGLAWAILQPLGYLLLFLFLRGVFRAPSEGLPFALTGYCGLVLWSFFSNAILKGAPSILNNRGIVKKQAMQREAFPASSVLASLVDLVIASLLLAAMMIFYAVNGQSEISVGWAILWVPIIVILTALLAFGVAMIAASVGTFKHDLILATPFLMQFWLLVTPLIYRLDEVPQRWQVLYSINPMVGLVEGFRAAILENAPPDVQALGVSALGVLAVWLVAWPLFVKTSQHFADVL